MTCHDVTMMSQTSHFTFWGCHLESRACSHTADKDWTTSKNIWICSKKHSQNKHTKVKDYLLTNKGEKLEKKTKKRQKIVKIHSCVDSCYGNVNHHRHVIDTGKFSLINFRKSHEIWWLFVEPFKSYNWLNSARAQCASPPPGLIGLKDNSNLKHCCFYLRRFPSIALRILSADHLITFLACALAHAPSELGRFSMKTEQLREITGRFPLKRAQWPPFF